MSPDWLEYILVRELIDDENMFDFLEPDGINIVWEDREEEKAYYNAKDNQQKKEPPEWLKLVVNNDEQTNEEKTDNTPKE